jgi:hypothetical protein
MGLASMTFAERYNSNKDALPPARAITSGPGYHWFGYYDKHQFDPTNRYVLGMAVDFEDRSPGPDDIIKLGMVDLQDHDRWIKLGQTRAWNWQQGCMLQWRPGFASQVVWNDREEGRFVCHLLDIETGWKCVVPHPIYTISPDGRTALSVDFERIQDMRPGYGYAGIPDPNRATLAPDNAGIYRVDLESGKRELVISVAQIAAMAYPYEKLNRAKHYFNHLLFNPDGTRFIFLHRWRQPDSQRYRNVGGFGTRMFTAAPDGSDIRVLDDFGYTSHFIWRDSHHVLAWARRPGCGDAFYLFTDGEQAVERLGAGVMTRNGHCTYLPDGEWILNDTYPDEERWHYLYLYHPPTGRTLMLGRFYAPPQYQGEQRVDTHPRSSRDGRSVVIDSAHGGNGRQMYLIEISQVIS